jgi:hypothetical protein
MKNRFNTSGSAPKDMLFGLLSIVLVLLYFWGLAWSFYRHGAGDGVIALLVPPYAIYRGAAFFWEEPAWKEKYGTRTEELAMLIAFSSTDDPTYQIESRKYMDRVRNWVGQLPDDERKKLLEASNAFASALEVYLQVTLNKFLDESSSSSSDEQQISKNKEYFMGIRGFSSVWEESIKQADLFQKFMSEEDFSKNRNENEDYETKAKYIVSRYSTAMESTINSIFE